MSFCFATLIWMRVLDIIFHVKVGLSMDHYWRPRYIQKFPTRWRRSSEKMRIWWQSACGRKPLGRLGSLVRRKQGSDNMSQFGLLLPGSMNQEKKRGRSTQRCETNMNRDISSGPWGWEIKQECVLDTLSSLYADLARKDRHIAMTWLQ